MRTGDLRRAAATLERARERVDRLIVERRREGASLRTIAAEAGVSHETVAGVVRRASELEGGPIGGRSDG